MFDTTQILIVAAVTIMTVVLTIIGIQLIFILKDVRRIIHRADNLMDSLEAVGLNVSHGYGEVIGFITGVKKILNVVDYISTSEDNGKKHSE